MDRTEQQKIDDSSWLRNEAAMQLAAEKIAREEGERLKAAELERIAARERRQVSQTKAIVKELEADSSPRHQHVRDALLQLISPKIAKPVSPPVPGPISLEFVEWLSPDHLEMCARVARALVGMEASEPYALNAWQRQTWRKFGPKPSELTKSVVHAGGEYARVVVVQVAAAGGSELRFNDERCEYSRTFAALTWATFMCVNGRSVQLAELTDLLARVDVRSDARVEFHDQAKAVIGRRGDAVIW